MPNNYRRVWEHHLDTPSKMRAAPVTAAAAFPDTILAEIVHFPEARFANVLIRARLRKDEIPYIGYPVPRPINRSPCQTSWCW
ncbi:lantibiotic dehydratase family protein [Chitinophaga pendula]|uniref:hypothetical protein n=1 Tax=Chitinophaga TaxID=79328 RepID=UPI000BAE8130|nr:MULTISPECIES: hypothetical protein [Chitinophaga]ASZ14326.1 hypothetical protein CK934_26955 [Chitinophaga sp. MD30]UCJ08025.1 lantibiotic dehydratase family protein [Chitinophaga pendula]